MKKLIQTCALVLILSSGNLSAHCQMPCGIYHDDMVYDHIDQYVETMYKAMSEINSNTLDTAKERSQFVRWVLQKEKQSDEAAELLTTYFLQQKIKPNENDTTEKVIAAHNLLFLMVQIKQNTDVKLVFEFMEEWDKFKHMFHREGYECRIEKVKLKKWKKEHEALKQKSQEQQEVKTQDHEHD